MIKDIGPTGKPMWRQPRDGEYPHWAEAIVPGGDGPGMIDWLTAQFGPRGNGQRWTHWFSVAPRRMRPDPEPALRIEVWFREPEDHTLFNVTWIPWSGCVTP